MALIIKHLSRGLIFSQLRHSTALSLIGKRNYTNYDHEMEESEASPEEQQNLLQYVNKVTLVGKITNDPIPLKRDEHTFGYNFVVQTQFKLKTEDQVPYTKNVRHSVSCFNQRILPILSELRPNDWVMVDGHMAYYTKVVNGERVYKTTVRTNNVAPIKKV